MEEKIIKFVNEDGKTEYAMEREVFIEKVKELKQGERIWYRDVMSEHLRETTIWKYVVRTMVEEKDVFLFRFVGEVDIVANACIIQARALTECSEWTSFETQCQEALDTLNEWMNPADMVVVDKEGYKKYFG